MTAPSRFRPFESQPTARCPAHSAHPLTTSLLQAHASATRIYLRKGRAEERVAKVGLRRRSLLLSLTLSSTSQLADSPDQPEGEATYKISPGGIEVNDERARPRKEGSLMFAHPHRTLELDESVLTYRWSCVPSLFSCRSLFSV